MLKVSGNGSITTCDGITRRDFLQVGALGALGFTLSNLAALKALGAVAQGNDEKSVILIFNLGAPSQLDTWDMKPDAPREIRGPFKPIQTNNPDIQISEIFPLHAKLADKFSLVRTCYHTATAVHDTGHQMMQTGRLFAGVRVLDAAGEQPAGLHHLVAGVVKGGGGVVDAADERILVGVAGHAREDLADAHAGDVGVDGLERAAHFFGGVGL